MAGMNEFLDQWLRDAHAMEKQAERMLSAQAGRLENYPELRDRIEHHIGETTFQADRIEECLSARGASTSTMKDVAGQAMAMAMAMMQGLGGMFAGDEEIKG